MVKDGQSESKPAGIIDSLGIGFSLVARRPVLLLIPILLDLFLWLGPPLSISPIASDLAEQVESVLVSAELEGADPIYENFERNVEEIFQSYNVFSALSTWPLGVPSLQAGREVSSSSLGTREAINIHHSTQFLAWLFALALMGLLLGSAYLDPLARLARDRRMALRGLFGRVWIKWLRILGLLLGVLASGFLVSIPFFLVLQLMLILIPPVATLILFAGIGLGVWLLFHLFFSVHGILADELSVRQAALQSVVLVRFHRFSTVGLLIVANVINLGVLNLCAAPPTDSWIRLAGIVGNAFVATGLAAATFVFYSERVSYPAASDAQSGNRATETDPEFF